MRVIVLQDVDATCIYMCSYPTRCGRYMYIHVYLSYKMRTLHVYTCVIVLQDADATCIYIHVYLVSLVSSMKLNVETTCTMYIVCLQEEVKYTLECRL